MPRKASQSTGATEAGTHVASKKIPVIGYALLGRLAHHDQTGYDLSLLMGPPKNYNWEASHSQIYPVLGALAEAGYVTFSHAAERNKKVYSLTDAGREALRAWVAEAPTPSPTRNEFNLKVFSLWLLSPEEAIDVIKKQIALVEGEIADIDNHLADAQRRYDVQFPVGADHHVFGLYSSVMFTRESRVFTLQWYRWMLDEYEKIPPSRKSARRQA
ncbi:PadR family transcriptional regulator [Paraburkholderia sp. J63]|uniref:PadR family transcriptional regulator n=1 Tax=Paraburkholderia sp. J63 TaxID=2805434 RepID=UPI002ABEA087|nr:PadR family transcriptional regulator [Paraburkholderia sp. J63]